MNSVIDASGNRFAFKGEGERCWYDMTESDVVDFVLKQERRSLLWDGPLSLWVLAANELRSLGLLTEPPLPTSPYVERLRKMGEEIGEPLPDYIERVRRELAQLEEDR